MSYFDFGYYKKKVLRKSKKITIDKKIIAWKKGKSLYDGKRSEGYGGFYYDGRWLKILPKIIKKYGLTNKSQVLEIGSKKGFLLYDLKKILPKIKCFGVEDHIYPIKKSPSSVKKFIKLAKYNKLPFKTNSINFVISNAAIYSYNFGDLIEIFKEINRVLKKNSKALVSVAAYENHKELEKFKNWSTLSTVVLSKKEWLRFFKLVGYKGDYFFIDQKVLGIK